MTRLPARSGADIHLADAFEAPGCPVCRELDRVESAYLESILAESVDDVGFRGTLMGCEGHCAGHSRAVLDADRRRSGSLGAAILLRASLLTRLRDLEAVHAARGWNRTKRLAEAARPPACPACYRLAGIGPACWTALRTSWRTPPRRRRSRPPRSASITSRACSAPPGHGRVGRHRTRQAGAAPGPAGPPRLLARASRPRPRPSPDRRAACLGGHGGRPARG